MCEDNLRMFFSFATLLAEFLNACSRIEEVLLLPEISTVGQLTNDGYFSDEKVPRKNAEVLEMSSVKKEDSSSNQKPYSIKKIEAYYPGSSDVALSDINTQIPVNELTGIIGAVGCGKSTIFSLILNELEIRTGYIDQFKRKVKLSQKQVCAAAKTD